MNLVSVSNGKSVHVPYRDSKLTFLLQVKNFLNDVKHGFLYCGSRTLIAPIIDRHSYISTGFSWREFKDNYNCEY